ncbi:MAG: hypothetical protein LBI64_05690 [Coriobacteriales bacterium]|jgi:hypothetical protein|nr:hypothetical protein [Coriobacteriales bacterium]
MFILTDEVIESTISSTSGLIVATVAEKTNLSVKDVSERFLDSKTFALLRNKDTGYYWDSIAELIDMFTAELKLT